MAIAFFSSLEDAETLEVAFAKPKGGEMTLRLLVNSGFTGRSCFVLPNEFDDLGQASAPAAQVFGAIQGVQKRVIVSCRIMELSFEATAIAILADTSTFTLPPGVRGLVGLRFLRYFRRWGAEHSDVGGWRFFLEADTK